MAIRKSAPKTAAKKPTRPEKKAATKRKPAESKKAEAKKASTRAAEPAAKTKQQAARKAKAAAPASKPAKATKAAKAAPAKQTKATIPPPASRSRRHEPAPAAPSPAVRARKAGPPRTVAVTAGSGVVSKLGTKWNCYQCGSKFYDLNKPEPLCPRCGADQRQRPKVSASSPPTPPAPKKQPRPMAPLLDDEDDGTVRYDEEFDLGVRTDIIDDAEEDLFPTGEAEEEDVFGGDEE